MSLMLLTTVPSVHGGSSPVRATAAAAGAPIALTLAASTALVVVPGPVTFAATVTGGSSPYRTSWAFGDGNTTSGGVSELHEYMVPGTYLVLLTVTDSVGRTGTVTCSVYGVNRTIPYSPNATATPSIDEPGAAGTPVLYNVTLVPGTPVAYHWAFGDGNVSTAPDPWHVFQRAGVYTTVLTLEYASNFNGQWSNTPDWNVTYQIDVVVVAAGADPLVATLAASVVRYAPPPVVGSPCLPSGGPPWNWTVQFAPSVVGGVAPYAYDWQFGDGSNATTFGPTVHTYSLTLPTVANVTVVDANGSSASASVAVGAPVVPIIYPGGPAVPIYCSPAPSLPLWLYLTVVLGVLGAVGIAVAAGVVAVVSHRQGRVRPLPPPP